MKNLARGAAFLFLTALSAVPARAQSLGDLAQKEKEKREAARAAGAPGKKVYGDGDLATYAGERPAEEGEAPAMSATPKDGTPKKPAAAASPERAAAPAAKEADARTREADDPAKAAEDLRARWREAQQRLSAAERRLLAMEEEMKTLPPGLPAGNYYDDIRAAVDQQKVEREQRFELAKKARAAAKEALDAVETEARRKQIRLE
jgi:hypothetical protein